MKKSLLFFVILLAFGAIATSQAMSARQRAAQKSAYLKLIDENRTIHWFQSKKEFKSKIRPYHPSDYYYLMADNYLKTRDWKNSQIYLDSALMNFNRHAYVEMSMLREAKARLAAAQNTPTAFALVDKFLTAYPDSRCLELYRFAAPLYDLAKNNDRAEATYRRMIELNDTARVTYVRIAQILTDKGQKKQALEVLRNCQKRFPDYAYPYMLSANLCQSMGDGHRAVDDMLTYALVNNRINYANFPEIPRLNPHYTAAAVIKRVKGLRRDNTNYLRAISVNAYMCSGFYEEAAKLTEKIVNNGWAEYYLLAECCHRLGHHDLAIGLIKYYIKHYNLRDLGYAYSKLAEYYYQKHELDSTLMYYTKGFETNPVYYKHMLRGMVTLEKGDTVRAMRYFDASLELQPTDSLSMQLAGIVYEREGNIEKAHENYRKALESNPQEFNKVILLARLGQTLRAHQIIDSALKKSPRDYEFQYAAACLESYCGNTEKALDHLRKALLYGYYDIAHVEWDFDLDNIRKLPQFKEIIQEHRNRKKYLPKSYLIDELFKEQEQEQEM